MAWLRDRNHLRESWTASCLAALPCKVSGGVDRSQRFLAGVFVDRVDVNGGIPSDRLFLAESAFVGRYRECSFVAWRQSRAANRYLHVSRTLKH